MTTREALECRIYMTEDAKYRDTDVLDQQLHELEASLKQLSAFAHELICESGRVPLEAKAHTIAEAIEAFETGIDMGEITTRAERIASFNGLIDECERELAEVLEKSQRDSDYHPVLEALAAAS